MKPFKTHSQTCIFVAREEKTFANHKHVSRDLQFIPSQHARKQFENLNFRRTKSAVYHRSTEQLIIIFTSASRGYLFLSWLMMYVQWFLSTVLIEYLGMFQSKLWGFGKWLAVLDLTENGSLTKSLQILENSTNAIIDCDAFPINPFNKWFTISSPQIIFYEQLHVTKASAKKSIIFYEWEVFLCEAFVEKKIVSPINIYALPRARFADFTSNFSSWMCIAPVARIGNEISSSDRRNWNKLEIFLCT